MQQLVSGRQRRRHTQPPPARLAPTRLDAGPRLGRQLPHGAAQRVCCRPGAPLLHVPLHQRAVQPAGEQPAGQARLAAAGAALLLIHQGHAGQARVTLPGDALQAGRRDGQSQTGGKAVQARERSVGGCCCRTCVAAAACCPLHPAPGSSARCWFRTAPGRRPPAPPPPRCRRRWLRPPRPQRAAS